MAQPVTGYVLTWNGAEGVYQPAGGVPDASTTVKGVVYLSVAPANPTVPVAVGDNDPRLYNIIAVPPIYFDIVGTQRVISYLPTSDIYTAAIAGTQVGATPLLTQFNAIDTVAVANASVVLLAATKGVWQIVRNDSLTGNDMLVYPPPGANFRGFPPDQPLPMGPGNTLNFFCFIAGEYRF